MKIAIIGTGISGMTAARLLHARHELTVFESNDYIGGHTHTVAVEVAGQKYAIDTGFIVYNERTYPQFCRLLDLLGVTTQPSEMSFSVKCERTGLEYCGSNLNTLFTQRLNLFRPSFLKMLRDIVRFNREAPALLQDDQNEVTLGEYVERQRYSTQFRDQYLIPMGAAIWSMPPAQMLDFPARYFVQFCHNHGLLALKNRPQWRVIAGGSWRYVERLVEPFRDRIRRSCPVLFVRRDEHGVEIVSVAGTERFDHVIFATHGPQALRLLADASVLERAVLGAFQSQQNIAVLHTDVSLLPKHRRAWASWNYHLPREPLTDVAVTYQMNILQSLRSPEPFCVTLNRPEAIRPDKVIREFVYEHPIYSRAAVQAQTRHAEISGGGRTHFCGAYWGYGFHEDGVKSALTVAKAFGVESIEECFSKSTPKQRTGVPILKFDHPTPKPDSQIVILNQNNEG